MRRLSWKKLYPRSLSHALQLCKELAAQKNMNVERMADQLGSTPDTLYKWLSSGKMPLNQLIRFESVSAPLVTQYLANSHGYLLVPMPSGKKADQLQMGELTIFTNEVLIALTKCYEGQEAPEATSDKLMRLIEELAFQKGEVEHHRQPMLGGLDE